MKLIRLHILLLSAMLLILTACQDDFRYGDDDIGVGYVTISANVRFEPQASALESRATAGDAMKQIETLSVILYNREDTINPLVFNLSSGEFDLSVPDPSRPEAGMPDDYIGNPSESSTARATFTLPEIHVGKYYMYVVANMGVISPEDVSTPHKLKTLKLSWKTADIPANSQMFGYFTEGDNGGSVGYDAPLVTVSRSSTRFHAWLKRAASKVTVVYDASEMHNDILVYIHKVTIHDIPKTCLLGADNKPSDGEDLYPVGEVIYYDREGNQLAEDPAPNTSQYESWMRIGRGSGRKGAVDKNGNEHGETESALYFYENLQGNYENHPNKDWFYKPQKEDSIGFIINKPDQPGYKDNVPYGSYIEVEGYYVSQHAPVISQGIIKYRFMLGQDEKYDYDAFRNRHYKLTLRLKGYANQADWHIEYIEDNPEIYTSDKFYMSYLYNHKGLLPVRLTGECTHLEAEIIENNWAPFDSLSHGDVPPAGELGSSTGELFQWAHDVWDNNGGKGSYYYGRKEVRYDKGTDGDTTMMVTPLHAGFLSLTVPSAYNNESVHLPATLFCGTEHFYSYPRADNLTNSRGALRNYFYADESGSNEYSGAKGAVKGGYEGKDKEVNDIPQNKRVFDVATAGAKETGRNGYQVEKLKDGTTTLMLPLWTRPKSMLRISGFTGNNPYESYQRKAVLRFRATFKVRNGSEVVRYKDVPIYQVRRVVNPKGVWRRWDNNKPFQVTLKHRVNAGDASFTTFKSEGSWKAYVSAKNGSNFISLSGGVKTVNDTIFGDTDSPIDFKINFLGATSEGQSNCAIVTVEYHGFSCNHTIFVRQGYYRALELVPGKGHWSSFSVYAAEHPYRQETGTAEAIVTKSPLALGSFFKRGNLSEGILIKNNSTYDNLQPLYDGSLQLADINGNAKSQNWSKIWGVQYVYIEGGKNKKYPADDYHTTYTWPEIRATVYKVKRIYTVPTYDQYNAIATQCDYGFGVLYADGATETADALTTAFGYQDLDNTGLENANGMRGVVVFNKNNANQVFFPVGARGIGRRTLQNTPNSNYNGTLRYGSQPDYLSVANGSHNEFRPICYNLPANAGAIYWLRKLSNSGEMLGWDMNYADLNFNGYDYATSFYSDGDALPIKLIWLRDEK